MKNFLNIDVTCAYCKSNRKYWAVADKELPFEGQEEVWCPKCKKIFLYNRSTNQSSERSEI